MSSQTPTEPARCERCGADAATAARPPQSTREPAAAGRDAGDEPATRCEWCGAEYPVPAGDAA